MSGQEMRICRTCGTNLAPRDEFCPVCALRGALQPDETATESQDVVSERRFGHYEILTHEDGSPFELGRGAMGITYKAFDIDLQRLAALKVISPRYLADQGARSRFLREARAAGSVRHPNVASVFQLGTSQENYFYAMEFVEGETLGSLIKRSTCLDAKLALEVVAQVAAGLDAIHKQKLVHRDIKPSNIMVSSAADGAVSVRIIDLGLAKTLTGSESQEISILGAFVGTPEFASPEQFTGTDVDIRSDLYSLGITLWQMLTGRPPFRGAVNEVMHQHLSSPLPLEKLQNVPQPMVALIEVLLRKEPARRFQTPAELTKALPTIIEAIETGQPVRQTIRIFVSFSSDLQSERNLANRIVRRIADEFDLPVLESASEFERLTEVDLLSENDINEKGEDQEHQKCAVCLQFREYGEKGETGRLPDPGNFDLVVCLLGNQAGVPVHPDLRLPGDGVPTSSTEYEIAWAAEHASRNQGIPALRVYRNLSKQAVSSEPQQEREACREESDSVRGPIGEWEDKRKGTTNFNRYKSLEEFEEQFRSHFRDFVADQVKPGKRVRRWKLSPFRGLNVFDFEHAPIFFGRAKAIGEVLEALEQQRRVWRPFVLIVGGSGSGKSSLVRAGVLPQLIHPGTIEGIGLWRRAVTRPGGGGSGGDCFDALANALLDSAGLPGLQNPESDSAVEELAAELRDHPDAVALRVRDALDNTAREWRMQRDIYLRAKAEKRRSSGTTTASGGILPRPPQAGSELPKARLALVIDQLEELFTSGFSTDIQEKYVAAIAGLAQSGRVFILATLRSDFYSSYQQFPELTELTRPSGKVDLRPPTAYEIGNMIRLPAEAAGLQFELDQRSGQRLDEGLRDAASNTPESLPLLQHVLSLLYDKQAEHSDSLLRWSDYRDLGELKGALAKYAETVFATLRPNEQLAFPLVMRHLVTLGQGEEEAPNRRTAPHREFVAGDSEDGKSGAKGFVDLFIAKRLFIADTDPHGEVNVGVAHEALLREWQRIREWLAENRDFLRMRDRLDSSLKLWLSRGKQKDDLLGPGLPLAEGEKLLKDFAPSLSHAQTDYVRASVDEQKRRHGIRERIRFGVMAGITAALIIAVIFGLVSYRQYRRAERAKVAADQAAKRATLASNEAEKLINFMTTDLRDKLKPIGRLDLLADVNKRVEEYYDAFPVTNEKAEVQRQWALHLVNEGDTEKDQGEFAAALKSYEDSLVIVRRLVEQNATNASWQRDVATNLEKIGDILKLQGDQSGALDRYSSAATIEEKLSVRYPQDLPLQAQAAFGWQRIGELLETQGDLPHALESIEKSLKIRRYLVKRDANNVDWQYELSLTLSSVGSVLSRQGRRSEAIETYKECLAILQSLADRDKDNTQWQDQLAVSLENVGDELTSEGDLSKGFDSYQKALDIRKSLGDHDPTNTTWQRKLSQSYEDVAQALTGQGDLVTALENFRNALTIRERLFQSDPNNATWHRDLSISYSDIGLTLVSLDRPDEALENYRRCLSLAEPLAIRDPNNAEWQRDLSIDLRRLGEALHLLGKIEEALQSFQRSVAIGEGLVARDSSNSEWQSDLSMYYAEIGDVLNDEGKTVEAMGTYHSALAKMEKIAEQDPNNTENQENLSVICRKLGDLLKAQGQTSKALENYRRALAVGDKIVDRDYSNPELATELAVCCYSVAVMLPRTDDSAVVEARNLLQRARDMLLKVQQRGRLRTTAQHWLRDTQAALGSL
jgi:eukaryotic-like serine/threonine-protein kinase